LLSISWDAQGAAELLDAHLAASDVSPTGYITQMRTTVERIPDATSLRAREQLDDMQQRRMFGA
jgi:hypothetical protein